MGGKNAKRKSGDDKGGNENSGGLVNITNELFISESKSSTMDDYVQLKFLGEGSFAAVYKVQNRHTNELRAMKVIKKSDSCSDSADKEIVNEINVLRRMDHPNILKIFEFYNNKDSYSIVTELCMEGELFDEISQKAPFDEKYAAFVMYQIFSAINYCHNMNIIHRDIKPENILIFGRNENQYPLVKIGDFGTAKMFESGAIQKKLVGSSYYIAPEVLKKKYTEKCDVWSCGVILYILLSGRPPFGGDDDREIMNNVIKGVYDLASPPFNTISKECRNLIKKLLTFNQSDRISAEEALNSDWLVKLKAKEEFNAIRNEKIITDFIANLKCYKSDSVIQETALAYLVHNFSQREDIVNACKLFNQMDVSGDGKITKKELLKALKSKVSSKTLEQDVNLIFQNIDADNNGYIQYEEFVRAAIDKSTFLEEGILRFAFRYFDKDNSGEIDAEEIREVFAQSVANKEKVDQALKQIMGEVDVNGDNKISFEEFSKMMTRLLIRNKSK